MWRNPGETGLDLIGRDKAVNGVDDDQNGYVDDVYGIDPGGQDSDPMDEGGIPFHGTFCASIIGASGNDGKGITGVNWRVSIMAIRTFPKPGESWLSSFLEGYEYLLSMKQRGVNIRVANMSFFYGTGASPLLLEAHEAMGRAGIVQVCGAANNGVSLDNWAQYPPSWGLSSFIIVGGSVEADTLWTSSNYGQSMVDLAAPAAGILAAAGGANRYETVNGNSFSGPHVAGAAALLLAAHPDLTIDQLKAALFGSVDQPASFRGRMMTNGRLNVARAMEYLTNSNPPAIVVTASPRGHLASVNAPIQITFNRAMNRATVESAFEIAPPMTGVFDWAPDNRSFSFRHETPLDPLTNCTVTIRHPAADETGGTLDGNFNRLREDSSADDFAYSFYPQLPHDDFETATSLNGWQGFVSGNNRRASVVDFREGDVLPPDWLSYCSSLWYRWKAPETNGWVTFDLTGGTAFDSLLLVCAGATVDHLSTIAVNDNHGTLRISRTSFQASAGTEYSIMVAGKVDADPAYVGDFTLRWYPTPPPVFTGSQFSPAGGLPGTVVTLTGTNFTGATAVLYNGAPAVFTNAVGNNHDLRIVATVPATATSGPITVQTPHGTLASTSFFDVLPLPVSLRIAKIENTFGLSWNEISDAFVLEISTNLISWSLINSPRRIESGRTVQSFLPEPSRAYFRLKPLN